MNLGKIEGNVHKLTQQVSQGEFIYELLLAYGLPKASITRLKDGAYNLSKKSGEILWKKKLLFREVFDQDLHATIDQLRRDETTAKHNPRFIIVTDYKTVLAYDTKTKDTLDRPIGELHRHFDFFLPWSGREKAQAKLENPADIKAAEKMAKLYDNIRQDNPHQFLDRESLHELNVFLSRLLFCYFAEDTEIFPKKLFVNSIESHTQPDGSDLAEYLDRLFLVMNTKHTDRNSLPDYLKKFEYVNGGLFEKAYKAPKFTARSRKLLLECGELDWSEINPDIFGSMIQAVVHPDQRGGMGMHYTSVSNIMKVIEPLFLNELNEEFEDNQHNPQKLEKLLGRLSTIRIFDPACGSGNFLIIAYKELRLLEIKILKQFKALSEAARGLDDVQASLIPKAQMSLAAAHMPSLFSRINLSQFYGIELDDFAHEIAILSLWLAEHQMNVKFNEEFQKKLPSLPLKQGGKIVCDNATRIDWDDVCPKDDKSEIYVLGNPPYIGFQNQDEEQKREIISIFSEFQNFKRIDYIGCWFKKASDYIESCDGAFAFVSTNSICQGEQVCLIWPYIFEKKLEIFFAHQSFNWGNNAKNKAKVTCVIVGVKPANRIKVKHIYNDSLAKNAKNISPYLVDSNSVIITPRNKPLSQISKMSIGNVPLDGNSFILSEREKEYFVADNSQSRNFIKRYMGASDFMSGIQRYCIWITDKNKTEAEKIPLIAERIDRCKAFRMQGGVVARQHVHVAHRFRTQPHQNTQSIIFPKTTSSRRTYVPAGFLDENTIISEKALAAYGAEPYLFGILSSKMHMVWLSITSSRMRNDFQYSVQLTYNTFPLPMLSEKQKETITTHVFNILEEREKHSEKTIAELYDPKKMPKALLEAHEGLDQAVERSYRAKPFTSDEERLEHLFKLYEEMTSEKSRRAS